MKITPQDIIDKEFRVKFRGFDMSEVDTFLEEVAENFLKLTEENTRLNEKIIALQQDMESGGILAGQGQMDLPPEVSNFLEELKQDTAAISAELASLKQDRQTFVSLEKNIKEAVASLQKAASAPPVQNLPELPADLGSVLEQFKRGSESINVELAGLKEDRQAFASLKKDLEEALAFVKQAGQAPAAAAQAGLPADLTKTLDEVRQGTEALGTELGALKQELGALQEFRGEIKTELQELLASQFDALSAKLEAGPAPSAVAAPPAAKAKAAPGEKKEPLVAAIIAEEPEESVPEDTRLPDYEELEDASDDELEFLSEDDILDVDKLRGVFQSVLDESVSDGHNSRETDDDASADLLFFGDDDIDDIDDEHEPEVTFSLDEEKADKKQEKSR